MHKRYDRIMLRQVKLLILKFIILTVNFPPVKPHKEKLKRIARLLNLIPSTPIQIPNPINFSSFQKILQLETIELKAEVSRPRQKKIGDKALKEILKISGLGYNIIAIAHDNYSKNIGGVQTIMNLEKNVLVRAKGNYWSVHPSTPSSYLAKNPILELFHNESYIGSFSSEYLGEILKLIEQESAHSKQGFRLIIHSLLGHDPESIAKSIQMMRKKECDFYLHDFYTLCPSFKLLRNNLNFCHCPEVTSTSCKMCMFGNIRASHVTRVNSIINQKGVSLIAPSESTRSIWLASSNLKKEVKVVPHLKLEPISKHEGNKNQRPRIAFFGPPNPEKGWKNFLSLHELLSDTFDFYVFAQSDPSIKDVKFVFLNNSKGAINHTRDLLIDNGIDYAFIYPNWPETYSLVTAEAISAGVFVLTNDHSGNVAALVKQSKSGAIFESPTKVAHFLLKDKGLTRKRKRYDSQFVGIVSGLVGGKSEN